LFDSLYYFTITDQLEKPDNTGITELIKPSKRISLNSIETM